MFCDKEVCVIAALAGNDDTLSPANADLLFCEIRYPNLGLVGNEAIWP